MEQQPTFPHQGHANEAAQVLSDLAELVSEDHATFDRIVLQEGSPGVYSARVFQREARDFDAYTIVSAARS
jgi:hypothetical protein